MHVRNIRVDVANGRCRLSADVHFDTHWVWGNDPFHLWYDFPSECSDFISAENADPFIPALLTSAMSLGEPLKISDTAAISSRLSSAIPKLQDIFHCWSGEHSYVEVDVQLRTPATPSHSSERSAIFYSLGVDSSYTLSKCISSQSHDRPLPQLVMVEGFDVYLWERQRFPPMHRSAANLAKQLGTEVLTVTTNLRELSDRVTEWVRYFYGSALASTVLSLGCYFTNVKIAASQTYRLLVPSGAHPLLDPLWSTEWTQFAHDGLEASRLDKVRAIARVPSLVQSLRVCTTGELTDAYNCGRCEKCIRTMIGLHIAGALELCETLPHTIELEHVRSLRPDNKIAAANLEELITRLGRSESEVAIAAVLRERINAFHSQPIPQQSPGTST